MRETFSVEWWFVCSFVTCICGMSFDFSNIRLFAELPKSLFCGKDHTALVRCNFKDLDRIDSIQFL